MAASLCPCGSGILYDSCCGKFLSGNTLAQTAEQLMRSRFTAFVRGESNYLLATWHPSTRPSVIDAGASHWRSLEILDKSAGRMGEGAGTVEFRAYFQDTGGLSVLQEKSRFTGMEGRWYYLDAIEHKILPAAAGVGRNQVCPCGSGRKFKQCCGVRQPSGGR